MLMRLRAVARKETIQMLRDPRTLAVVVVLPVLMLVLYGYAINFDVKQIRMVVCDYDHSPSSRELVRLFERSGYFHVVSRVQRLKAVDEMLDRGRARVALVVPSDFSRDLARGRAAQIQTIVDGSDSNTATIALGYISGIVRDYRPRAAPGGHEPAPIEVRTRVWFNPQLSSTHFIVPGLVAVMLMLVATLLTALTVVRERERGTMEQLVVSPLTGLELLAGKLLPYGAISLLDVLLVLGAGRLVFGVPLRGSGVLLLAVSLVFILAALSIGALISTASRSQQGAMTAAFVATMLPTFLLTGFVFPIASMPRVLQAIAQVLPATHFLVVVRGILLKGVGLEVLWPRIAALAGFAGLALTVGCRAFVKRL